MENEIKQSTDVVVAPFDTQDPPRVHRWKKILFITFAIPVALFVIWRMTFAILSLMFPDSLPPNDAHLALQTLNIPKDENAYDDLLMASSSIPASVDGTIEGVHASFEKYLDGTAWDAVSIRSAIVSYASSLEFYRNASHKKFFQYPLYERPEQITFPEGYFFPLSAMRRISRIATLGALQSLREGNIDIATEKAFDVVRIGALFESSPQQNVITYLVGTTVKGMGLKVLSIIEQDPRTSTSTKALITRDIVLYRDDGKGLMSAFKLEYFLMKENLETTQRLPSGEQIDNYISRPNQTATYYADHADFLINRIDQPCAQFANTMPQKLITISLGTPEWWSRGKIIFIPNSIGKILYSGMSNNYDSLFKKRCDEESQIDQIVAAVAR